MIRIGNKIEGVNYTKRPGSYVIIEREEDKKVAEPIEKDHTVLWVNPEEYKDKLFHEYQRYILDEYVNKNRRKFI